MDKQQLKELSEKLPKGPFVIKKNNGAVLGPNGQMCMRVVYMSPEPIVEAIQLIHELAAQESSDDEVRDTSNPSG